jgi:peptide/nickel transport system ATP-binding protein/oligopeptide transport system ATP-binding protein
MLTVASLRKVYNGRGWKPVPVVALDDVSLELGKGESLGVLGKAAPARVRSGGSFRA